MHDESFSAIPGFSRYEINAKGVIRRRGKGYKNAKPGHVYRPRLAVRGYLAVGLYPDEPKYSSTTGKPIAITCMVHNLMARTFLGLPPEGHIVNHKNAVKTDNHPLNLEYMTGRENNRHAAMLGLYPSGARNANTRVPDECLDHIMSLKGKLSSHVVGPMYGVSKTSILNIWKGNRFATRSVKANEVI